MSATDRTTTGRLLRAAVAVLMLLGLGLGFTACGLSGSDGPPPRPSESGTGTAAPVRMAPLPHSVPQRIKIPSIGVNAPIIPEGLDAEGRLEAPPLSEPDLTGWYSGGPSPGQLGPAVIEGHVDSKAGPAVFYKLSRLTAGANIEVTRKDGSRVVFRVDTVEQVDKDSFPTQKVYGGLDYSALRLITCGGAFNRAKGSYEDNIIVYAHRIPI